MLDSDHESLARHQNSNVRPKKNILKSNSFDVVQTVFFAFTCKFGLVLQVEKVVICINLLKVVLLFFEKFSKYFWIFNGKVLKKWSSFRKKK